MIYNGGIASIKKSTADQVADYLREQIIMKELKLGERLVEANVAKKLNVSITPVRQALMQLTAERLILSIPYKGSYVTEIDENYVSSLATCRLLIEGEAARTAYDNLYGTDPQMLLKIIDQARRISMATHSIYDIIQHDMRFHRCIIEYSDNKMLPDLWDTISSRIMLLQSYAKREFSFERFQRNHAEIANSLAEGRGKEHFTETVLKHHQNADTSNPEWILSIVRDGKDK